MKKRNILKTVLLLVVVVLANIYIGCVHRYPKESAEERMRLKQLELNQQLLMQQTSRERQEEIEALKKEIEELKKQQ